MLPSNPRRRYCEYHFCYAAVASATIASLAYAVIFLAASCIGTTSSGHYDRIYNNIDKMTVMFIFIFWSLKDAYHYQYHR